MTNGFLLIDKPKGLNSFKLVLACRRIFNLKKVGFAGTLDPLASGLMIVALGEYTKLLPYLEKADKVYEVTIELGKVSDTFDLEGEITEIISKSKCPISKGDESKFEEPNKSEIQNILNLKFSGSISQIPPRFSAIKIKGQKAYDLARKGEVVVMAARQVVFHDIKILDYNFPFLKLSVHCSSGTYIRSLAHDLGAALKIGGVVTDLRRVAVSQWKVEDAKNIDEVGEKDLIPAEKLLKNFQRIELSTSQYQLLAKGNFIAAPDSGFDPKMPDPWLGIYQNEVVGILEPAPAAPAPAAVGEKETIQLKFRKKFNIV